MPKNKIKKIKKKKSISTIEEEKLGGKYALSGFAYQILYSCFTILNFVDNENKKVKLDGIEDIDTYNCITTDNQQIYHIQLKESKNKQDASFLKKVLKNFLEIYLTDTTRQFKLVYDFDLCGGNFQKIINKNLDDKSEKYWQKIIQDITHENPTWNWAKYDFHDFLSHLFFENVKKDRLACDIENILISKYDIKTGNEVLYANGLYYFCYEKILNREAISFSELKQCVQLVKDEINKGSHNPAYKWIQKINFENVENSNSMDYYAGKKAEPIDIVQKLPVRRRIIEQKIQTSIEKNKITVIKSSSGQGKTTLALQVAYNLRTDYTIYKLQWCGDKKELDNIVEYCRSRIKIGEKLLILVDNLDAQLKEWNSLAQLLSEKVGINYKLLLTTREDDWYLFAGDQSYLKSLQIIHIDLDATEAEDIYDNLKKINKLYSSAKNWQYYWEQVAEKKLLIEYIYLLTQGEMLSSRIDAQIKNIQQSSNSDVKYQLLRQICFADVIGIKLPVKNLISHLANKTDFDVSETIKSLEKEFYIKFSEENIYIEGLHPIRSQHIVERLHEYFDVSETLMNILKVVDESYASKLYSVLPQYIKGNKEKFYQNLVNYSQGKDYKFFFNALQGIFVGSVLNYYQGNKTFFDDANEHSGLMFFEIEINPFCEIKEFNAEVKSLTDFLKVMPDNENIKYLHELSQNVNKIKINETDAYFYAKGLYEYLNSNFICDDLNNLTNIISWLIHLDTSLNLLPNLSFNDIWNDKYKWGIKNLSELMYCWFLTDQDNFTLFAKENRNKIINYLKEMTLSASLYENQDKTVIHVEYILLPQDVQKANEESVKRIEHICKTLPIYETYCADAIKPELECLNCFNYHDSSHKEMPIKNIVIGFNSQFSQLWSNAILSKYEFESVYEWLNFWVQARANITTFIEYNIKAVEKKLNNENITQAFIYDFVKVRNNALINVGEKYCPGEKRPFHKKILPEGIETFQNKYFYSMRNYINQSGKIIAKEDGYKLALLNLGNAKNELIEMQQIFENIIKETQSTSFNVVELSEKEIRLVNQLEEINLFYIENEANRIVTRNYIKSWNERRSATFLKNIIDAITRFNENNIDFVFPKNIIKEKSLIIFPLIVKNIDITNEKDVLGLIKTLIGLRQSELTYVDIGLLKDNNQLNNLGIRISRSFLENPVNPDDNAEPTFNNYPMPSYLDTNFLNAFFENFEIYIEPENPLISGLDTIYLLLWEYSQYTQHLSNSDDLHYLKGLKAEKELKIRECIEDIKDTIPVEKIDFIKSLKEKVFTENYYISTKELNDLINDLITTAIQMK